MIMAKRDRTMIRMRTGFICILFILLITPVYAAIHEIPAGGTVFIGEERLDITACGVVSGDTLGWFEGGRSPATDNPVITTTVSDAASFYISPQTFTGRTGTWYIIGSGTPAFMVAEPTLGVRIYDVAYGGRDRTGLWVPMDYELQFRIETNLNVMSQRPGVAGAPIEIRVTRQDGVEYSSLTNRAGASTPLLFAVDRNPYMTGPVWHPDAGYSRGVYDFYAFCNANGMKDNYEIVGKTITERSETISLSRETTPTPTQTIPEVTPTTSPTPEPTILPVTTIQTGIPATQPIETPDRTAPPTTQATPSVAITAVAACALGILLRMRKE